MTLFDPEREQLGARPIWLKLSQLPMHLWTEDIFQRIGDNLGKFLDYYQSFIEASNMSFAWVLIFLDTREGLVANLILQYKGYTHNQKLGYEGVPFHCQRCHKVGHIYKDCPLVQKYHGNGASCALKVPKSIGNNVDKGKEGQM